MLERLSCVFKKYPAGLKYTQQHTRRKNVKNNINMSKNCYEIILTRIDWNKNITSIFINPQTRASATVKDHC